MNREEARTDLMLAQADISYRPKDDSIDMAIEALENQKTGHWIEKDGYDGDTYYDCSECGESFCLIEGTPIDNLYNYCPNCGAKMKGENDGNS